MTNSRVKGAAFERQVANLLHDELGIKFERILDQTRTRHLADLRPVDCDDFPFVIECKRYESGPFQQAWWDQACTAALVAGKLPIVVYRFDRQDLRARMHLDAVKSSGKYEWPTNDLQIDVDQRALFYICRESLPG